MGEYIAFEKSTAEISGDIEGQIVVYDEIVDGAQGEFTIAATPVGVVISGNSALYTKGADLVLLIDNIRAAHEDYLELLKRKKMDKFWADKAPDPDRLN